MPLPSPITSASDTVSDLVATANSVADYINTDANVINVTEDEMHINVLEDSLSIVWNADYSAITDISIQPVLLATDTMDRMDDSSWSNLSGANMDIQTVLTNANAIAESWKTDTVSTYLSAHVIGAGTVNNAMYQNLVGVDTYLSGTLQEQLEDISRRVGNISLGEDGRIPATRIAGGQVSNVEYGYLDGVTKNIQDTITAIDAYIDTMGTVDDSANTIMVNASIIAGGNVNNTVFQHISSLTSSLQAQITALQTDFDSLGTTVDGSITRIDANVFNTAVTNTEFQFINTLDINAQTTLSTVNTGTGTLGSIDGEQLTIDAARLGTGWTNAVWRYINGITSDAQAQITTRQTILNSVADTSTNSVNAEQIGLGNVSNIVFGRIDGLTETFQIQVNQLNNNLAMLGTRTGNRLKLSASNVSTGTVSNAHFDNINGLTGAVQTQLSGLLEGEEDIERINATKSYGKSTLLTSYNELADPSAGDLAIINAATSIGGGGPDGDELYLTTSLNNNIYSVDVSTDPYTLSVVANAALTGFTEDLRVNAIDWDVKGHRWIVVYTNGGTTYIQARNTIDESESTWERLFDESGLEGNFDSACVMDGFLYYIGSTPQNIRQFNLTTDVRHNIRRQSERESDALFFTITGPITSLRDENTLVFSDSASLDLHHLTYSVSREVWELNTIDDTMPQMRALADVGDKVYCIRASDNVLCELMYDSSIEEQAYNIDIAWIQGNQDGITRIARHF